MRLIVTGLLFLLASPAALADLVAGEGEGYVGSAWYDNSTGSVVHEQSYALCVQRLQDAMNDAVDEGLDIVSWSPCTYRPPHPGAVHQELSFAVDSDSPGGGLADVYETMFRYSELRRSHDMDGFEAAVGAMVRGDGR